MIGRSGLQFKRRVGGGVRDRVVNQNDQHLFERIAIAERVRVARNVHLNRTIRREQFALTPHIFDQRRERDRLAAQRVPSIRARQYEQLIHKSNQPFGFIFRVGENFRAFARVERRIAAKQFDVAANRCERCAKFVRCVRDKAPLRVQRLFELEKRGLEFGQHRVERGGELTDLVVGPGVLHAACEIAFRANRLRRVRDAMNRIERRPGNRPADRECGEDHQATARDQNRPQGCERLFALLKRCRDLDDSHDAILHQNLLAINQQRFVVQACRFKPGRAALHGFQSGIAEWQCRVAEIGATRGKRAIGIARLRPPTR